MISSLKVHSKFQASGESESMQEFEFVCEKPINKQMLICVACGNGSFEYIIEPSKQGDRKSVV